VLPIARIDWTAVGAVAGPVLALVALAWQATEKLRRPVLDQWFRSESWGRSQPQPDDPSWGVTLLGKARVINPRPTSIIVERWEMQARRPRRWQVWKRHEVLNSNSHHHQIAPIEEAEFDLSYLDLRGPVHVRMSIKLRGSRRWLRGKWSHEGSEAIERAQENAKNPNYSWGMYRAIR
jgi:hypothetical protein